MTALWFVLAAAAGATLRHGVAQVLCGWQALFSVNVAGAAVLGYVVALDLPASTTTVLATGFAGALTTFSSFALEVRGMRWPVGLGYAVLTIATAAAAASLGASLA